MELTWEDIVTEDTNGSGAEEGLPSLGHWLRHCPCGRGFII